MVDRGSPRNGAREEPDGRRRRSQRSRERILDAVAEALSEPDFELTPERIATRSGYSISTIFRHFGDQEGLARAMHDLVFSRVQKHLTGPLDAGDLQARVRELVRRWAAVYETIEPFLRTLTRYRMAGELEHRRSLDRALRAQISEALAPELAAQPEDTVEIAAVIFSFGAWSHAHTALGLSPERCAALFEAALLRVLGEAT